MNVYRNKYQNDSEFYIRLEAENRRNAANAAKLVAAGLEADRINKAEGMRQMAIRDAVNAEKAAAKKAEEREEFWDEVQGVSIAFALVAAFTLIVLGVAYIL